MGTCYSTEEENKAADGCDHSMDCRKDGADTTCTQQGASSPSDNGAGKLHIHMKQQEASTMFNDSAVSGKIASAEPQSNEHMPADNDLEDAEPHPAQVLLQPAAAAPASDPQAAVQAIKQQQQQQPVQLQTVGDTQDEQTSGTASGQHSIAPIFTASSVKEGPQPEIVTTMKQQSVSEVLRGAAYQSDMWGPPRPACQNERMETLVKVKNTLVGKQTDPDIDNILKLALKLFGVESAVVSLVADKSYKLQDAQGALAGFVGLELSWLTGICGYTLEPEHHEVLVVEDMTRDARFCADSRNGFAGFYCGAPLVAANGHRLGTLCLGHSKPGTINAQQVNILCNLTEMVVRHLEKAWVNSIWHSSMDQLSRSMAAYVRPLLVIKVVPATAAATDGVSFVGGEGQEGSAHGGGGGNWTIEFANQQASELMGLPKGKSHVPFWESVQSGMRSMAPWAPFTAALESRACFSATFMLVVDKQRQQDRLWLFEFRPAGREALDAEARLIGVPSWLPSGRAIRNEAHLFFVEIAPADSQPSSGSSSSRRASLLSSGPAISGTSLAPAVIPVCFAGLELGPLLGKGSYGRVYRGDYNHMSVAVKVIDTEKVRCNAAGEPLEAIMMGTKKHPNILQTIGWTVASEAAAMPGSNHGYKQPSQTWLLLEYCDKPCVQDAIDRGMFREGGPHQTNSPSMSAICWTAYEISCAMAALHSHGIVHSDLKGGNVLLKSANNSRGFEAKVADFGMARQMGLAERIHTNHYGTVTHCSPEWLLDKAVSKASDVWAFGVMMWELFHGTRAWAGLPHPQVMHAVAHTRLTFNSGISLALPANDLYFQLAEVCMAPDPAERPSFGDMHLVLKSAAEAWDKLKTGPNNGAQPSSLKDSSCTHCLG